MWTTERSVETTASPESIWWLWSDMATWGERNADIERIQIARRCAAGSSVAIAPVGQSTVELRLSEVSQPKLFVDEANLGDVVVTTFHRMDRLDEGRSRVTLRCSPRSPRQPGDGFA